MKKPLILCVVSAALGAAVAIYLYDRPVSGPTTNAQEPAEGRRRPSWVPGKDLPLTETPEGQPPADVNLTNLTAEERTNVAVYQKCNRSAVNINTKSVQTDYFFMREIVSPGEGSGTVIDREGHVLTNFHVVENAREIQVTLFNGKTYEARPVGVDPDTDVAVLKIDAPQDCLFPVTFGDSSTLRVGQRVFAIGNPFGLERTLTTGIISSLNRSIPARRKHRMLKSIIQTDAAINPGNSGGPLLDSRGRTIGMNTAIASKTGESAGVGFAIPANTIVRIIPQLITQGRVIRPDIGIARVYQTGRGLLIAALVPGGAAEKAGLQGPQVVKRRRRHGNIVYEHRYVDRSAADLIVAVDGKPVRTGDDLLTIVESKRPGQQVVVTVEREGKQKQIPVRLGAEE